MEHADNADVAALGVSLDGSQLARAIVANDAI
jgi:hypothetical protein